jgi:hypothetical protein
MFWSRSRVPVASFPWADNNTPDLAASSGWSCRIVDESKAELSRPSLCLSEDAWLWIEQGRRILSQSIPKTKGSAKRWYALLHAVRRYKVPASFVCEVPNGCVTGPNGTILTEEGRILADCSYISEPPPSAVWEAKKDRLDGCVLPLLGAWADRNYCHWMLDVLPRLALPRPSETRFLVPAFMKGFHRESLELMGIDETRQVSLREPVCQAEKLLATRIGAEGAVPHRSPLLRLREMLLVATGAKMADDSGERFFLMREGVQREIANMPELLPILKKHEFRLLDPGALPLAEAIQIFAGAKVIAGGHGAAMVNQLFCPPRSRVIEIFHPVWWNGCYLRQASLLGHEHWHMFGRDAGGSHGMHVPPETFARLLDYALGGEALDPAPI